MSCPRCRTSGQFMTTETRQAPATSTSSSRAVTSRAALGIRGMLAALRRAWPRTSRRSRGDPAVGGLNGRRDAGSIAEHGTRPEPGAERDAAPAGELESVPGGLNPARGEHASQDDAHLEHREARAHAAPATAAERDPGEGAGLLVQEALRA